MSEIGPLQHPDLLAVDALLDERKLDEAQRRLAVLGQRQGVDHAVTYLTTRLLYLRGRLDVRGVADRLRDLLRAARYFPQAQYMLDAAETGVLSRSSTPARNPTAPPAPLSSPALAGPLGPQASARPAAIAQSPVSRPAPRMDGGSDAAARVGPSALPPLPPMERLGDESSSPAAVPRVRSNLSGAAASLDVPRVPSWAPSRSPSPASTARSWPPDSTAGIFDAVPPGVEPAAAEGVSGSAMDPRATAAWAPPAEVTADEDLSFPADLGAAPAAAASERPTAAGAEGRRGPRPAENLPETEPPPAAAARSRPPVAAAPWPSGTGPRVEVHPMRPVEHAADSVALHRDRPTSTQPPGDPLALADAMVRRAVRSVPVVTAAHAHSSTEPGVGQPPGIGGGDDSAIERVQQLVAPAIPRAPAMPRIEEHDGRAARTTDGKPSDPREGRPRPQVSRVRTDDLATRYSEAPRREEFVFSRAPSERPGRHIAHGAAPGPSPLSRPPGAVHPRGVDERTPSGPPPVAARGRPAGGGGSANQGPSAHHRRVTSDFPPQEPVTQPTRPSLFEVATLLDAERYSDALSLLGDADRVEVPERALLRARALAGAGQAAEAHATLSALASAPELDVDLRAGVARLFVELGDPATALRHARLAAEADADRPLVRLTLAWAAIRAARASGDRELVSEADQALDGLKTRGGPHPGLVQALRGCVQAVIGDAERAIGLAQRALGLDPRSPDALAAVAIASARLHRVHDAQQAWLRLRDCAPEEAEFVATSLRFAHIAVPAASGKSSAFVDDEATKTIWRPEELAILSGDRRSAQWAFESACRQRLTHIVETGADEGFPAMGAVAIEAFTEDPILGHFCPYDLSLWSIPRIRAGLDLIYDPASRLDDDLDDFPITLLIGAYLGQVLCHTFGGRWEGSVAELGTASVVCPNRRFSPFAAVAARLRAGRPLELGVAGDLKQAHPGADAWSGRVLATVRPPSPWGPATWPPVEEISRIGRALSRSVVSEWCRKFAAGPLDGSMASLASVQAYLALVAPPAAPPSGTEPWLPRVTVFVGAYLGEVLRETIGGAWEADPTLVRDPMQFRLRLGPQVITPMVEVLQRMLGHTSLPLHDYASRLAR